MVTILESPLYINLSRTKKFILNLNNYRNMYFRTLNNSKIAYKATMKDQILDQIPVPMTKIAIQYRVYKGDKRRFDVGNIASIHQKYFEDAIVELGRLPDDRHENIPITFNTFGGVSDANPRVEITIYDLTVPADIKRMLEDIRGSLK